MNSKELSDCLRANFKQGPRSLSQRKPLYGVGINDADYVIQPTINGKRALCKAYQTWSGMLQRAYSDVWHKRYSTYMDVTVCDEWHKFSTFKKWFDVNYVNDWQLDKDLLTPTKVYSPDTCLFIPSWLNKFTIDSKAIRGNFPIGVSLHKRDGVFQSNCKNPITHKKEYLGSYRTPEKAHLAWMARKIEIAYELKDAIDAVDARLFQRVLDIISNLK